ncbi:hypothetical protein Vau01_089960 [Virgisporangium aurantiacum]|uniref:Fibronectin type-III domain-containing protein n=1 Tax=Virgisporangium aurantiacum TaxID=175570 RepID=A0A8J4E410_9ACTN|nr:hypothetical protein Vau01_089960 [Virgisporangium aurantiacum]
MIAVGVVLGAGLTGPALATPDGASGSRAGVPGIESTPDPDNSASAPPEQPVITGVVEGDGELTVTWDPPDGDAPTSYTVWVGGEVPDSGCDEIPAGTHTCTVDTGLENETSYAVEVAANHTGTEPAYSQAWWATPRNTQVTVPGAPTLHDIGVDGDTLTLTWDAPGDDGGLAILGYTVTTVRSGDDHPVPCEQPQGRTSTTCTITGTAGVGYTATVTAWNSEGEGPASNEKTATVAAGRPGPPTALVAVDGRAVTVSWTPHGTGGAPIQGYLVTVHREGQPGPVPCAGQQGQGEWSSLYTGSSCTFTGVPGATYTASVKARNSVGTSDLAGTGTGTVPALAGPHDVAATPGNATATVTWTAITPATGITGYTVTYTREGGQAQTAQVPGAAAHSRELTGLENGATYSVTVKAVLGEGTVRDSAAVPVTPSAPATIPDTAPEPDDALSAPAGATTPEPGGTITVSGTGFAPNSRVELVIYSSPRSLGTATTAADGSFSRAVVIPSSLSGSHTVTSFGVDPDGDPRVLALGITVAAVTLAAAADDSGLAATGAPIATILLTGVLLIAGGAGTRVAAGGAASGRPDRG